MAQAVSDAASLLRRSAHQGLELIVAEAIDCMIDEHGQMLQSLGVAKELDYAGALVDHGSGSVEYFEAH
jgi:hypothetical protein